VAAPEQTLEALVKDELRPLIAPLIPRLVAELRAHPLRDARLPDLARPVALGDDQEPVGLHDLRHSFAANSFALGLTDVEVARLLRHANPRVTTTVYAGLVEGEATRLGERLAAGGFGA
jgi:integrase